MTPLLEVDDAAVDFHVRRGFFGSTPVRALRGVSLTLARGETLALAGESGSGKTTLARATLRLVPLAGGRVTFDGLDIATLRGPALRAFRRRTGVVFQDPWSSLSPFMRVFELVEEPLIVHGPRDRGQRLERVTAALEQVRLSPASQFADVYPHQLSGGQRQRVGIARAMVLEPEYLVADEPVSMIDASSRAEILALLRELQERRGIGMLYVTHDLASARTFADRIAVMYAGAIVEQAPARELIDAPRHPYAQALLAAVPAPDPANRTRLREVVAGEPPTPTAVPAGCAFQPRCPVAIAGRCEVVRPPLIEVVAGHQVACHHYPTADAPGGSGRGGSEPEVQLDDRASVHL